jgi:two-component system, NtrC family, sensor histidine kinase HydH
VTDGEIDRISHVLSGSLQGALLNLQSLAVTLEQDAALQESIALIRAELLRGARMLHAAFEILSLELGDITTVNLRALVTRALKAHGVERIVAAAGAWPDVTGDERLLGLAIAHLARNASAATPRGRRRPEIRVSASRDGGVVVVVHDWGGGFGPVNPRGRAFTSGRPEHVATGLLTAERVARLHGGCLSVDSSSRGTAVRLSLPPRSRAAVHGRAARSDAPLKRRRRG